MSNNPAVPSNGSNDRAPGARPPYFTPRVDIWENADELVLLADLPGVKPEDVDLHCENGELRLRGRCAPTQPPGQCLLAEYQVGDFFRTFTIREEIQTDRITADIRNGVLTVHLPKSEKIKPRKIAVKAQSS